MIGEIWDTIIEGIGTAWDALMEIPEQLSGFFTEVNMSGFLILSLIGEFFLWGFWYYVTYVQEIQNFLDMKIMIIGTVVTPFICYILAWRASKQ